MTAHADDLGRLEPSWLFGSQRRQERCAPGVFWAGRESAAEEESTLDTLQERLAHDLQANRAVGLIPAVVGAWGHKRPG